MRKSILPIFLAANFLSAFFLPALFLPAKTSAQVSQSTADYLAISPKSDWVAMAQAAIGDSPADISFLKNIDGTTANDYATYILAITALGQDPRFFGEQNLVALLRLQAKDGQIGDSTLISDDIFALLALRSAGLPADDSLLSQTVAYLKNQQLPDGSWSYAADSSQGGIDMTAAAVMSLLSGGASKSDLVISRAVDYLANAQGGDAGFPDSPGSPSNTESTAWVLSALNKLGEDLNFWQKNGAGPADYLRSQEQSGGYFSHNSAATALNSFTPITTAYAAIALAGKFFPVASIAAPAEVSLRIEGRADTVCQTKAEAKSAMDAVKSAAVSCGYAYTIIDTQYGPYLKAINNEEAAGLVGWSFLVNNESLQIGAADYLVNPDDEVLLYYGNWDDLPLRVTHSASVELNSSSAAKVEKYDYNNDVWQPAAGATLRRGSESFVVGADGQATLNWTTAGASLLWASGDKLIRSAKVLVSAGQDSGQAQNLPLAVDIVNSAPDDGHSGDPGQEGGLVFSVSGDLNFGSLSAGQSQSKNITISNAGAVNIAVTASVSESSFFASNLSIDQSNLAGWRKQIAAAGSQSASVKLSVPANYSGAGRERGVLIIWANPLN